MNQIYRLVWSQVNQAWVAVAENARGHGKSISSRKLVAAAAALIGGSLLASSAYAADARNATVVGGQGSVNTAGTTTTINQTSQRLAINWNDLSTAANEALVFRQPNAQAIALNRITGSSPSNLLGSLTANGQVYILNPNGVLFGSGAQVNVGGLVASTLSMDPNDFMNGGSTFAKDANAKGSVENQGKLTAANGGYIALLSGTVRNEGTIDAPQGTALLAAGDKVTLDVNNGSLIGYKIDQGDLNALIENRQLIKADGGQVIMVAKALDKLSAAVINNTGVVEARTVQNKNGHILLLSDMDVGTVNVGGTLDASAPNGGNGGFIETSAAHVKVADGATVTTLAAPGLGLTGSWLIDPTDFTIVDGNAAQTSSGIGATTLANNLANTSVTLATDNTTGTNSGDINVNAAVSWNAATTLTLSAWRNININQSITATNAAGKLALEYGLGALNAGNTASYNIKAPINLQAGDNFSTKLGSNGATIQYKVITSLGSAGSMTGTDLQGVRAISNGNYVLGSDIDASATSTWNGGAGFTPIGSNLAQFAGTFNGLGHIIKNLVVNLAGVDYTGLFGYTNASSIISNVGLVGGSIRGWGYAGALIGQNNGGTVSNCYATGSVTAVSFFGGLVGFNGAGATITNSYATGNISSFTPAFGDLAGGLVGSNYGTISNSYASGNISTGDLVGGLVGRNEASGVLSNTYATGTVTANGTGFAGGLGGSSYGTIINSYSSGQVFGSAYTGGFLGSSNGAVNSFWNTTTSGLSTGIGRGRNDGITGIDNNAAKQFSTFKNAGWSISATGGANTIWRIYDGQSGPLLRSFLTQITVTGGAVDKTYDGTTTTAGGAYTTSINGAVLDGSMSYVTSKNAGSYSSANGTLTGTGLYSDQQGYDIIYTGASVTIDKANITLSTSDVTKTYDGTTVAAGNAILSSGALVTGDGISGGTFTFTDKNAGTGNKTVTTSGVRVGDGVNNSNYNISYVNNTTSTINKANVTLSTSNITKTYDGTTAAAGNAIASVGAIFGSDTLSGGTFAFTDRNVGTGHKSVTASGITINDGNGGNNYNVTYANNTASTINKANVTLSTSNVTKTYDGTTTAAGSAIVSTGAMFGSDSLSGGAFAFTDRNAGTGNKSVTASGITINDGNGGNNYNVTYANNTNSTINKANVTLSTSNVTKTYDGTTTAAGSAIVSTGAIFGSDSLSGGAFAFTDRNAGAGNKTVTVGGVTVHDGNGGNNYNVTYANNTNSTIDKANVTLSASNVTKTYDGTTTAAGSAIASTGAIFGSDSLSGGTFAFTDKNAGAGNKAVTAGGVTVNDGNGGNNYNVTYANNTTSTINKADVTLSTSDVIKTYDGGTTATGNAIVSAGAIFGSDSLSGGTFAFTDKNAGAGNKAVTAGGVTVNDGNGGNNYNVTYANNTTSTINKADVTLSTSDVIKTYDGTTGASGNAILVSGAIFTGDNLSGGTFAFSDKNAGSGNKTVTASGATVGDGVNNSNYNITYVDNTASTINKADVTLSTSDVIKTYDGGTTATGNAVVSGGAIFGSDSLSGGTFAFTDKNAGNGNKAVTTGGVTVNDGNGGNNYNVTYANNTTSTIIKADLNVTANAADKVYDGTTNATITYTDNRIAGDNLNFTGVASFADKNVGNGKAIAVGSIGLGGVDAGNYNLLVTGGNAADITPASLTISADSLSKLFDGHAYVGGNGVTINGLVNGETMADLLGALSYGGSSQGAVGIGNYVITPGGLNSGNYRISFVDGVLRIKAISQTSAALGGATLEQPYDTAQKTIADIADGDDRNAQSESKPADKPSFIANNNATLAAGKVTPRLNIAGCGMSMPVGSGC